AFSPSSFTLNWPGADGSGSGIASYSVYVSDNGGAYTALLSGTTNTTSIFTGQNGHSYAFYSVATDRIANVQPTPSAAPATTPLATLSPHDALPISAASPRSSTPLRPSGAGSGSGIACYSVYVSDNGGAFTALLSNTTTTSTTFTGQNAHRYAF